MNGIERRPRRTRPQDVEERHSGLPAARVLVAATPAVHHDDREYEAPALVDQILVSIRIELADLFGHPTKVVLHRPAARVLEVHEEQPALRIEHIPRVRLAVQ